MVYKQEPPFAVQIELVEGCNLRCSFCGINGIRGKERTYKFMTAKTAERIASELARHKWNSRIEFAMHGEPSLHPDAAKIIAIFRKHLPRASMLMLSNGGGLQGPDCLAKIRTLFNAGLNTLGLDEYQNINLVPKILATINDELSSIPKSKWDFEFFVYPDNPLGNPHARQKPSVRRLVHIRPIDANTEGTHATLNNHAGAGAPKNSAGQGKPCAKPFRELSFRWDGSTAICCNDWRGELATGNIHKVGLMDIWHGRVMDEARKRLILGLRDFGPCAGCDATSYRVGLLPDKFGHDKLPKPTPEGKKFLDKQASKKPLTPPVKREWEK
jgi:MoaA/NifB/PqqE/SkfB family radical SAM enzyme